MKKIVWSETRVEGGKPFNGVLPAPPSNTGEFQNIAMTPDPNEPKYYQDIAVIAYKLPGDDVPFSALNPVITSSGGNFNLSQLTDGDVATTNALPIDPASKTAWIQFAFESPQTFKSITIADNERDETGNAERNPGKNCSLQISDDGVNFHLVYDIPLSRAAEQTMSFPAAKAKFFRVVFTPTHSSNFKVINIAELALHTATRINRFEERAGFAVTNHYLDYPTPASADTIALNNVVNLTGKFGVYGKLNWIPPQGNWNIVRFGYSLLGTTNHPASAEATGLEVDKLDSDAVKSYFEHYLGLYNDATQGLMGKKGGLRYIITDSWEAGPANWTNNMLAEFSKRRGYDMLPWMPVLTGHIVVSSEASEKFLWDYRKTLGELVVEYHYDELTKLLHARGMKRYSESHEAGRALIADGMDVKRTADIPMSAMWTPSTWSGPSENYIPDITESASVAHIYGQNLVAAESMTAYGNPWSWTPEKLKPTADLELSCGLNRFVIHTSVHQPTDDKIPGLNLGPFGQWFNRHDTWAEYAKPWTTYLSRSSYLLQQGKFVADIVYYYGEDDNISSLFRYKLPDIPNGYKYDFVNADALLHLLSIKNRDIVTPSGMRYKLLVLDSNTRYMPLQVLKKIKAMVDEGAIVLGPMPVASPSLMDNKADFSRIVSELWGNTEDGPKKVFSGMSVAQALDTIRVKPDFAYTKPDTGTKILYVHRQTADKEIYWVNNRSDKAQDIDGTFRVSGKTVEIWHAETGQKEPGTYAFANGFTKVPLHLLPHDAVFVIFYGHTNVAQVTGQSNTEKQLAVISGSWQLSFQEDRGAPASVQLGSLTSWTKSQDDGIKYFSGTTVYSKTFNAPLNWSKNKDRICIDLGSVKDIAEVFVNGKSAGILWKHPFKTDITGLLKPGDNKLEIHVTNTWVNRLIGDQQTNQTKKYTYTTEAFYQANSPLLTSGLLGPVTLMSSR
jgi:hypothetical protein